MPQAALDPPGEPDESVVAAPDEAAPDEPEEPDSDVPEPVLPESELPESELLVVDVELLAGSLAACLPRLSVR